MREFKANAYQRRFFLEWQLAPHSTLYNTPLIYTVEGAIDERALAAALSYFVDHYYEDCRSRFYLQGEQLWQQILAPLGDVLGQRELGADESMSQAIEAQLAQPFDLQHGPLLRFMLLRQGEHRVLVLNFHHIIADARSAEQFVKVLGDSYRHLRLGTPLPAPPCARLPAMDAQASTADVAYWCQRLAGQPLGVDLPRQDVAGAAPGRGSSHYFALSPATSQALRSYARSQGATPFLLLAAGCAQVLGGYTGATALTLHYPVDMRPAGARHLLGCYINNYPLAVTLAVDSTFEQQVAALRVQRKAVREQGHFTLTDVLRQLRRQGYAEEHPFNVSLVEAYFDDADVALGDGRLCPLPLAERQVVGDLLIAYQIDAERIRLRLDYPTGLFSAAFIQRLADSLTGLLEQALLTPQRPLCELDLLTPAVRLQLHQYGAARPAPAAPSVMALFLATLARQPEAPALRYRNSTLSYRQLARAASALAAPLRSSSGTPQRIGLYLQRKDLAVVAMLGILGSGNAYIPIDPHTPLERLRDIVADSGMHLLLCDQALPLDVRQYCLAASLLRPLVQPIDLAPAPASALAYLIYTSGSSGQPKGVCIEHGSLGHLIDTLVTDLQLDASERIVGATAVGFDIFGLELFGALACGACLLLLDEERQDPTALCAALDAFMPTLVQGTPSFWSMLALAQWRPASREQTRLLCGGEALSRTLAAYLLSCSTRVQQVYGPSETTIWSTRSLLTDPEQYAVIGRPIGATCCYVLDAQQRPVPWGASGELYIGGAGLSSGYHRRPELSAERFVSLDPLGLERGPVRLYRSGDRVRWNDQGELVYLGRLDLQVKVRGHRVEPGEIEHALHQLDDVRQAVVRAWTQEGHTELAAYVVATDPDTADPEAWRAALQRCLPSHMVPRYLQRVTQLPHSLNGKVDRQALPPPQAQQARQGCAPTGALEQQLAQLWQSLLQGPPVSADVSFFEAGGHSLLAAQLLIAIGERFHVRLSLAELLRAPTIQALAAHLAGCAGHSTVMPRRARRFALSLEQTQLYVSEHYDDNPLQRFNLAVAQRLSGALNIQALQRAWTRVAARHEQLHMNIVDDEQGLWQVYSPQPRRIRQVQVAAAALPGYLENAVRQPLDLNHGPLYEVQLLCVGKCEHVLLLRLAHLIADGWSLELLRQALAEAYNAECRGEVPNWPAPTQHYSAAVSRQQQWLASSAYTQARDYWRERLAGYTGLNLANAGSASQGDTGRGAHCCFNVPQALLEQLTRFCEQRKVSLFCGLFSVYALLLRRYCDQTDVLINVPSANRLAGDEQVFGLFTCLLPLRVAVDDHLGFAALVDQVATLARDGQAHQGVPLEAIEGAPPTQGQTHAWLQAVFAWQSANRQHSLDLHGVRCDYLDIEDGIARYPLCLSLRQSNDGLHATVEYACTQFSAARMADLGGHFQTLLEQALENPEQPLGNFELVTPQALRTLLDTAQAQAAPERASLVTAFAGTVARFASAIAVQDGARTVSYRALDLASTAVAQQLRRRYCSVHASALPAQTRVGLCVTRSAELLIGLLGILKAGAAYVPLDPQYPRARLDAIVADAGLDWVVADAQALADSGLRPAQCLLLDEVGAADTTPLPEIAPAQLAYVIYTSGSSGTPKGALLSHHNVLRLFHSSRRLFGFRQQDTWCLFHSYAFDFSVWEIWGALLHGARLVIVPQALCRDPEALRVLLAEQQVTVLNQTPAAFVRLIAEDRRHPERLALREVIFGGDALQVAALAPWFEKYADSVRLSNMYGITETTVHVTHKVITSADLAQPDGYDIGRPLADLQVLVLDRNDRLCPTGITGQLHVAGPGLAAGYLERPALSAQAFIQWHGLRLYRTGDLGRWQDNGHLQYLGRNDQQVKVRGFRIELGEVQATLLRLPAIREALVLHDRQREQLQAWYCAERPLSVEHVQAHLRQYLPAFMLPQHVQQVSALPLTPNGKVDRAALQALSAAARPRTPDWRAPATPAEHLLANCWKDVLQQPRPGADDDFFACGGDSLRVLDLQRQVRAAGYTFTPRQLYNHPTLAGLACQLTPLGNRPSGVAVAAFSQLDPALAEQCRLAGDLDAYPLTALQDGMLFHAQRQPGSATYLDVMSCRVQGPFDEAAFTRVLRALMQRHAVLRTLFVRGEQGNWQRVRAHLPLPLTVHALALSEDALQAFFRAELACPPSGESAPLWRLAVHCLDGAFHLTLTCHHAILDGWSVASLFTELLHGYDLALRGASDDTPLPAVSFADYVAQERRWRQDPAQAAFWQSVCADVQPTLLANAYADDSTAPALRMNVPICATLDAALQHTAQTLGVSLDLLLLAAHLQALSRHTGRRQVTCGMPSHGRLIEDDGQRTLGLFLNSVPCVLTLDSDDSPQRLVERLREYRTRLDGRGNYPLHDIQRQAGVGALFDSLFNFVNFRVFERLQDLQQLRVQPGYCHEQTHFTLVNQTGIDPHSGALQVELVYRPALFAPAHAERFALYLQQALRELAQVPASIDQQARLQALYPPRAWLGHAEPLAAQREGLVQRFTRLCAQAPQRTALAADGHGLSYAALDNWSTAIARQLLEQHGDALAGQRIGVFAQRSMSSIAALLGVLKVGAAYVPLDPAYPQRHLQHLLDDAQPALVMGDASTLSRHPWLNLPGMPIRSRPSAQQPLAALPAPSAEGLAYVMYTSGSSGAPKGVMIEQAGILRLVLDSDYVQIRPGEVVGQLASLSFDAATFEIWGALLNGATLALAPGDSLLDSTRLQAFLFEERVDLLFMTTRLFDQHVNGGHAAMFRRLRVLLVGGEVMDSGCMARLLTCSDGRPAQVFNCYGPTENTTFSTAHLIDAEHFGAAETPIGVPIKQTQVYVLDELGRQVPIGQTGELYLGGQGLARGYLNDPLRSAAAFVEHWLPDADDPQPQRRRLYRTGDAVRWLSNGELAFVGRIDRTVKLNGYRVNLADVEHAARGCAGVSQCVAVLGQGLLLYYSGALNIDALRRALSERLPAFMQPARLIAVDSFALNRNGKIDLHSLPEAVSPAARQRLPLKEPTQQRLFAIWQRLLGHDAFGAHDNFFECGGDSLLAMQLQYSISQAFGCELAVAEVFRYPTLASMASHLRTPQPAKVATDHDNPQRVAALKARRAGWRNR